MWNANEFLRLHSHHLVVKWVWCFGGTMLRAITDTGLSATIHRDTLSDLIDAGLMERGPGFSVRVVDKLLIRSRVATLIHHHAGDFHHVRFRR